jgi:diguanylate cyclase (GGDEF)-like protein
VLALDAIVRARLNTRNYCEAVFGLACALAILLSGRMSFGFIGAHGYTFAVLAAGVMAGEILPVKIPRRNSDGEIVLSTSFSMALLLAGGLGPAIIAQSAASIVQDVIARKPWWRIRFNVGQYTLSMVAAFAMMRLLSVQTHPGSSHPFTSSQLPGVLLAAGVFLIVNACTVSVAVALHEGEPVLRHMRNDFIFILVTAGVLLSLAPVVIAALAYSPLLIPLFLAPMLAIYSTVWKGARSEHAARHDSLTGLPNRFAFHENVTAAIEDCERGAMLLMDLDRFKEVNDTLGHHYGDLLLQRVAEGVRANLRAGDEIARLGGDEFAIFSPGCDGRAGLALARRIAESLRTPIELGDIVLDAPASIGLALLPADGTDVSTLLQKADVAMYRAKETHLDSTLYEERYDHHSPAKLALTADLRRAVDSDAIVIHYQPVLDLGTSEVMSVEALVRWQHPQVGLLPPGEFLDIAEQTSLIKPLTRIVLEASLLQAAQWDQCGLNVAVAVNLSTRVLNDPHLVQSVTRALDNANMPAGRLKLEVTESTLMADPALARTVLEELAALGVTISIDDFGTGYSSLAYLADLPVDEVKIDQSFVRRMAAGSRETIIVASTIDLAHNLGMRAVAEGVEDPELCPQLKALGCDAAQGFAISRPLAQLDATRWLKRSRQITQSDQPVRLVA